MQAEPARFDQVRLNYSAAAATLGRGMQQVSIQELS